MKKKFFRLIGKEPNFWVTYGNWKTMREVIHLSLDIQKVHFQGRGCPMGDMTIIHFNFW